MSGRVALALPVKLEPSGRRAIQSRLSGLTLVEVILVLSLLVIIGAVSVPVLEGTFTRSRLHHGGDLLRAAWARARLAATQEGQTYAFRFLPQESEYQILPLGRLAEADAALPAAEDTSETEDEEATWQSADSLPSGVVFAASQVSAAPQLASGPVSDATWSLPILFHPDGSTSDAVVTLANEQGLTLRVTLRGLTGTARTGEISSGEIE